MSNVPRGCPSPPDFPRPDSGTGTDDELVRALALQMSGEIEVPRDNAPNLRFRGKCLASTSSAHRQSRWKELSLYRTESGNLVCHEVGMSDVVGERERHRATVVSRTETYMATELPEPREDGVPYPRVPMQVRKSRAQTDEQMAYAVRCFFGYTDAAKELYRLAGMEYVEKVD